MIAAAPAQEKIVKSFKDTNYFAKGTYKRDYVELFSTATLANFATKTVLAPLERWKIIKQTQTTYELRPIKFTSFSNYLSKVSKDQGFKAFWRGNSTNLWLHGWQVFAQVAIFDTIRSTFNDLSFDMQHQPVSKFLLEKIAGPMVASLSTLWITHPIDTARIRISMNYHRKPKEMLFTGVLSCWSFIRLEERGAKGIYRGFVLANLIAILHLNIFNTFRNMWAEIKREENEILDVVATKEMVGSMASLLLLHPLDTLKKNLQLNNQGKPAIFTNSMQVFFYIRQAKGILGLYQGLSVTLMRHLMFCPIFAVTSDFLTQNVKIF